MIVFYDFEMIEDLFFFFFCRITNRGNNFPRVERGFFSFFFMILEYLQFCGLSIILEFL